MRNLRLIVALGCTVLLFCCTANNEVSFDVLALTNGGIGKLLELTSEPRMTIYVRKLIVPPSKVGVFELLANFVDTLHITSYGQQHLFFPQDTMLTSIYILEASSLFAFLAGPNRWLTSLHVYHCRLQHIPSAIANLTQLTQLSFRYCNITTLNLNVFAGNRLLKNVDLVGNQIKQLYAYPHTKMVKQTILSLNLFNNRLEHLNMSIAQSSTMLTALDVGSNRLQSIIPHPNSSFAMLESLQLVDNALTDSDVEHLEAPMLSLLRLSQNRLTRLPNRLQRFPDLTLLTLNNNSIHSIDMAPLDGLQQLQEVLFEQNDAVRLFSSKPLYLPRLSSLQLGNNLLTGADTTGWDVPMLEFINMNGNRLSVIPDNFATLPNLCTFLLHNNPLQCDSVMQHQKQFKTFYFKSNFEYGTTRCLPNQTSVMVSKNLAVCCHV